ncbi:hypothetical protein [Staphylococcus schweitzeri]|uniref:hypothetical protein n=1 Tax=Staphylococcus schweitzeri TaxID=1654388 RepID=UPI00050766D1|nr:hypothetical protein [Staphylococcus schweitzeri]CDR25515.1 hypothetical protein ERS140162_01208 [Staphylococcus schweitzeri]
MINENKYIRQQIIELIQRVEMIKYNTIMTSINVVPLVDEFNQIVSDEFKKHQNLAHTSIQNYNQIIYYELLQLLTKRPMYRINFGNKIQYFNFYHKELHNALTAMN